MTIETVDTLVVGAGQAGIAMSEHLGARGVPHLYAEHEADLYAAIDAVTKKIEQQLDGGRVAGTHGDGLHEAGLGHVSEIADAEAPHAPRGGERWRSAWCG